MGPGFQVLLPLCALARSSGPTHRRFIEGQKSNQPRCFGPPKRHIFQSECTRESDPRQRKAKRTTFRCPTKSTRQPTQPSICFYEKKKKSKKRVPGTAHFPMLKRPRRGLPRGTTGPAGPARHGTWLGCGGNPKDISSLVPAAPNGFFESACVREKKKAPEGSLGRRATSAREKKEKRLGSDVTRAGKGRSPPTHTFRSPRNPNKGKKKKKSREQGKLNLFTSAPLEIFTVSLPWGSPKFKVTWFARNSCERASSLIP